MSSTLLPNQTPEFSEAPEEFSIQFESADHETAVSTVEEVEQQLEEASRDGLMTSLSEAPAWAVSLVVTIRSHHWGQITGNQSSRSFWPCTIPCPGNGGEVLPGRSV